jgi:nondiscriminating glutamyl-tRNA synthetase
MTMPEPASAPAQSRFSADDVLEILRVRGWLGAEASAEQAAWCERAAALLGPKSADVGALQDLLSLVFHYQARELLATMDGHVVLSRYAARDVIRKLANLLLDPVPLTAERFNEFVEALKSVLDVRGRELFHPLRLALAGRSGEGELDRVVLLLDEAAAADFPAAVKSARTRIIEFCSALD